MTPFGRSFLLIAAVTLVGCGRGKVASTDPVVDMSRPFEEIAAAVFRDDDWPGWRGSARNGVVIGSAPVHWGEAENVIWKAPVPGRGHGSPTVVGDSIYLATADDAAQTQSVLAYDRATGELRWQTVLNTGGFPTASQSNPTGTNANGTIASDGDRLFINFLHHQSVTAYALDLAGDVVWEQELGPFSSVHGYAPSPQVHGSLVIVSADHGGGGFLAGLHRETGEVVWKKSRPLATSCSSAVVADFGATDLLVIGGCNLLAAYDPNTGSELWTVSALAETTCGTCVWDAERIYASGGYPDKQTVAVTKDGRQVWSNRVKCYESSMIVHQGNLYAVSDSGIAYCWDAATGDERWKKRLGGSYSASLLLADGNVHATSETGKTTIYAASQESFDLVAENQLGDEAFATPATCGGRTYHRVAFRGSDGRDEWLYCIGQESPQ